MTTPGGGVRALTFFAAFILAIWALGAGWGRFLRAWETPTAAAWLGTAGYAVVFVAALLYLGFWLYAQDRAAGRVRRRIGLYEKVLRSSFIDRGSSTGSGGSTSDEPRTMIE